MSAVALLCSSEQGHILDFCKSPLAFDLGTIKGQIPSESKTSPKFNHLVHYQFSLTSVYNFLSYFADKQTPIVT